MFQYLPRIEKRGTSRLPEHEAGWSLSYHGGTRVGRLVRASKYEDAGPFPLSLLMRAVEIIRTRYPLEEINGIVSVPPTKSGMLVETFARRVAEQLALEYVPVIAKVRETYEQKSLTNWVQKKENVKAAFSVSSPEQVVGRTFLLIGQEPNPVKRDGLVWAQPDQLTCKSSRYRGHDTSRCAASLELYRLALNICSGSRKCARPNKPR